MWSPIAASAARMWVLCDLVTLVYIPVPHWVWGGG